MFGKEENIERIRKRIPIEFLDRILRTSSPIRFYHIISSLFSLVHSSFLTTKNSKASFSWFHSMVVLLFQNLPRNKTKILIVRLK